MLNWKAVVFGAIVDFAGTYLATIVLVMLWMGALKLGGVADSAVADAATRSPLFLAVSVTVGWYFDYLGGKVAASIAGKQGLLHGLAAAVPGVILGLVEVFRSDDPLFPAWFMVVCCAVSLACACYGGAGAVQGKEPEAT